MTNLIKCVNDAQLGKIHIFSLGQAGFLIKNAKGNLLAIDPYLSDSVERVEGSVGFKRLLPKILNPNDISLDILICTHHHRDHFDIDSVPMLMRQKTLLLCPSDCYEDVVDKHIKIDNVKFIAPGDIVEQGGFKIKFINCDHGDGAPMAVGVLIEADGVRIVEVGDTRLRLDRVNEIISEGKVNVLIAPINGAYGNMNERDCVELANAVKPNIVIPCHYGMFASHGGNPGEFHKIITTESDLEYLLMTQGEKFTIGE